MEVMEKHIESAHSFVIIFPDSATYTKALNWLLIVSDALVEIREDVVKIKAGITREDLIRTIKREGVYDFKIIEIDNFEIVDDRTEEERLNEILDHISKSGYEFLSMEDRLFLYNL